jgi:antitoxin CcdA
MCMTGATTRRPIREARARPTNITLDAALVAEAKALGVNISLASAQGLEAAVKRARREQWLAKNADALESSNRWIEANGLPLPGHRAF